MGLETQAETGGIEKAFARNKGLSKEAAEPRRDLNTTYIINSDIELFSFSRSLWGSFSADPMDQLVQLEHLEKLEKLEKLAQLAQLEQLEKMEKTKEIGETTATRETIQNL